MSAKFNADDSGSTAKLLLFCGVVAGPLFTIVAVIEMLTRSGFDLSRHDLRLLSNGPLGWIQITNFVLAGLLTIAAAVGMLRVLSSRGRTWGPILIGIYGLGYVIAACVVFARRFSTLRQPGWTSGRVAKFTLVGTEAYQSRIVHPELQII